MGANAIDWTFADVKVAVSTFCSSIAGSWSTSIMADDQSGKVPDSSKSTSEADSQKEMKKLEMEAKKSPSKKSPKTKKAAKKRSKSHEKRKEKTREGKKHR